jgi:hypothetical protein
VPPTGSKRHFCVRVVTLSSELLAHALEDTGRLQHTHASFGSQVTCQKITSEDRCESCNSRDKYLEPPQSKFRGWLLVWLFLSLSLSSFTMPRRGGAARSETVADVRSAHNEEVCVCVWLPAAQRPNHLLGCVDQSINVVGWFGFWLFARSQNTRSCEKCPFHPDS